MWTGRADRQTDTQLRAPHSVCSQSTCRPTLPDRGSQHPHPHRNRLLRQGSRAKARLEHGVLPAGMNMAGSHQKDAGTHVRGSRWASLGYLTTRLITKSKQTIKKQQSTSPSSNKPTLT